jgi:hypothetical protein
METATVMAKSKKKAPEPVQAKKPKGFALPAVRGSEEWQAWVERLMEHDRSNWPDLVDRALVAYAKGAGFKEAPPKR